MLTPVDIENKMFKKVKIGGYDINEVEDFLEELIVDYEALYKENFELKDKLEKSEETENYYSTLERGVSKTIENSQKAADDIKDKAMLESEQIKSEAELEAKRIIDDAKMEKDRLITDAKEEAEKIKEEASKMKEETEKEVDEIKEKSSKKINMGAEEIKLEIRAKELELEKIKKEMQIYKIKVKSMLEAQLEILNDEE
ncbi:MAG: DivIVA domain-containing protein [Clostridia bacterium]|nr:DivIVA domain-containing protein [Clostridia bacterium]